MATGPTCSKHHRALALRVTHSAMPFSSPPLTRGYLMQIKSGSARVCFASSSQIICIGAVGRKQKKQEFSLLWRKARQDLVAWWHRVLSSLSTVPGSAADASHNHRSSTSSSSWWVSLKLPKARLERERKKVGEGKIPNDGGGGWTNRECMACRQTFVFCYHFKGRDRAIGRCYRVSLAVHLPSNLFGGDGSHILGLLFPC